MKPLEINMETLTPLWTGDVRRNSGRICETGIIGCLRWWYEGIIRGMGGYACDPITEKCDGQRCPVCRLFGTTGYQRRFRLKVSGLNSAPLFFVSRKSVYQASGNWLWRIFGGEDIGGTRKGRGTSVRFNFGVRALWGKNAKLLIIPLRSDGRATLARLSYLLNFVSRWGALGAKKQYGFGQVKFSNIDKELSDEGYRQIKSEVEQDNRSNDELHFNLKRFFSQIYDIGPKDPYRENSSLIGDPKGFNCNNSFIPCAFDIRYKSRARNPFTGQGKDFGMRPWFKERYASEIVNGLFGNTQARSDENTRSAGRIGVSHLYRKAPNGHFYLKIWGFVPHQLGVGAGAIGEEMKKFVKEMFPYAELETEFSGKEVLES